MKRPFAWFCIALTVILVMTGTAGIRKRDSLLCQAESLFSEGTETDGTLLIAGTVADGSAVPGGMRYSINRISIQTKDKSQVSVYPSCKVFITTEYEALAPGDSVVVSGEFSEFEKASNPGEFDVRNYYFSLDTVGILQSAALLEHEPGTFGLCRTLYRIRCALRHSYESILTEKAAKTIAAISLGEKKWMENEWKEIYQEGGIAHILAVSGLHITLIGMCLYQLLRSRGIPFAAAAVLAGAVVLLYAVMTGFAVSARRACVMFLVWLGSQIAGRKYDMLTAAAAAALAMAVLDLRSLGQSSFWLSFGAVLSVAILTPAVQKLCRAEHGGSLQRIASAFLSGAAIWLGTLPCTLYYFYQSAPWSILVNLVVLQLMSVIMASGMAAAAAGLVCVPVGKFLAAPVYYLLACFDWLCELEQKLPKAVWVTGRPAIWQIILYYMALCAAVAITMLYKTGNGSGGSAGYRKKPAHGVNAAIWQGMAWVLCAAFCIGVIGYKDRSNLRIVCLDVGQGDGAVIMLPGGISALIDGGSTSRSSLWEYTISQTVKYYGIDRLDYVFLSHADTDHISGIEEFLEEYEPGFGGENIHGVTLGSLVLPPTADAEDFGSLKALADEKNIEVLVMEAGALIGSEGKLWSISCLAPDAKALSGDANEDSMVLLVQHGAFRMLFTGDVGEETERKLVQSSIAEEISLRADILKVPHHGSRYSSSSAFLAQVGSSFSVISCGENNSYGHPAAETLERLSQAGNRILQTPQSGAVIICSSGDTYSVKTMD